MVKKSKKQNSSEKKEKSTKKIESIKKIEKKKKSSSSKKQSPAKDTKKLTSKLINKNKESKNISNEINIMENNQTDLKNINIDNTNNENKNEIINNDKTIQLKSNDNKIFNVPIDILTKVKLISGIIEDAIEDNESIFLNEVDSKNMELIIDYLQHYKDKEPKEIPKPFPERTDEEFLKGILNNDDNDWTYNFISKLDIDEAINLVNCAHFLQIQGLINILTAKLAHEMTNCEVEEARKKFGIECDMTEEEVAEYDRYPLD